MTEPDFIKTSKRKCKDAGMNPNELIRPKNYLSALEFAKVKESYNETLSVVSFFSNKLLDSLKGTPILVVVSDANGYLLEIEGDASIKSTVEQFGITIGSLFTQEDTGTNVVSLALQQKHPISLIGEQHYHKFLHGIACYGTVFHIPDEKKLLGSVCIMMPISFQNPLFSTMLEQAVDSIERELLLRKQNKKLNILNQIMLSKTKNGIVITDEHGIATAFNDFAQRISNTGKISILGSNICESSITGNYFKEVLQFEKNLAMRKLRLKMKWGIW